MNRIKTIYHIADVHIRNIKRHNEYRQVFNKMFDEIRKRGTEDSIIYLAGDIAHAKLELSPELIREISWLFTECSKLCETILITGNHDCNMNNSDRLDVLTPIVEALNLPNFHYLRDTGVYQHGNGDVEFAVFSIFDKRENWPKADTLKGKTKIALFHGPLDTSQTDIGYVVSSRHFTPDMFDGYDLALLGDIHKRQIITSPKGCKIAYAGSLVQQNFGETLEKHGLLVWDLDKMSYEEIDIQNDYGYYTMDIDNGNVPKVSDMPKNPRLRVRLSNTDTADTKRVIAEIKQLYGVDDFTIIRTDSLSKSKTGNRNNKLDFEDIADVNYQNSLINDYIGRMMPFVTKEDLDGLENINRDINSRITHDDIQRNIHWKPVKFTFSNMFSYGENNKIDFTKVGGLMGLFAPNAAGKSSLFDAISFCLYDKCSRAFKASNILNNRKTDFVCNLHFQIDGINYHIERTAKTINKGKNVKVDVQFWKEEDGLNTILNGNERRDTNQIIEQYVGKYEDFILTALSLQGNNALFIDKSQSERKDLLAQFMGINVFDKLYDIASEDIKEVSILIKNFKKTDFTSELAEKRIEFIDKTAELKDLEKTLSSRTNDRDNLGERIVGLSAELVPMDGNLNIDDLNQSKTKLQSTLNGYTSSFETKKNTIIDYSKLVADVSESMENTKKFYVSQEEYINIEEAHSNYVKAEKDFNEADTNYKLLKQKIQSIKDKIAHLETHEYDPNCKFCCDNVFVKDALKAKEELEGLEASLDYSLDDVNGSLNVMSLFETSKEQYKNLQTLKLKYQKGYSTIETEKAELNGLKTKIQLAQHQLEVVEENIRKYYVNEETIKRNTQIETMMNGLQRTKKEIESEVSELSRKIGDTKGVIASISSFVEGIKSRMNEVKDLEEKNRLYTYYLDSVKRDGIPYELISKALPVIENEVNNILAQVVDFSCVMEMDGKSINAKIVYDDQEWPLEMCSGMEKFVSGLAIRVALINICNLPRPNFLVIDEGFGTLDSDNLSSLFMMMQYLKTQFDFIWVISHLEQMRDIVDGLIEIKKVDGFSKISF
jgi:DNA repair exonuclease SbcCD ATPase subunit